MRISELRAHVRAKEVNAGRKVARIERTGVKVRYSEFDPRQVVSNVDRMSSRQLRSYAKRLDRFTDRGTQFEQGYKGAPLPRADVEQYKRLETARNLQAARHKRSFDNIPIAPSGMTVGQRREQIEASRMSVLTAGGSTQYRPYDPVTRSISGIVDADKLKRLTRDMRKTLNGDFVRRGLMRQRANHVEYLKRDGSEDQAKAIESLTLKQFDVLINHTEYGNLNKYRYLTANKQGEDRLDRMTEDASGEIGELIDWAKTIK